MKKTYQIQERRAIQRFFAHLSEDSGNIQLALSLSELARRLRRGVTEMLRETGLQLLGLIMEDEVNSLTSGRYQRTDRIVERWGTAAGSVMLDGYKAEIKRPRVREGNSEIKLGSYELFRRDDETQRHVWERIMRGLTMRGYQPAVRGRGSSGLSKSRVSGHFVMASAEKVQDLLRRDLSKIRLCALQIDGVEYKGEHFVVALGIDESGAKTILGFHQGATENQQICDQLLADLSGRGLNFNQHFIAVIDGSRALRASIKKHCGDRVAVQRCQLHKRRNVTGHFAENQRASWNRKLTNAYGLFGYEDAKRALRQIHRELDSVNPSAARSLDEGLEETLTVHRLKVPAQLRRTLSTTNPIESAFSGVRIVCRNVKRWRSGNQRERWIGSALLFAERRFRRVVGYKALGDVVAALQAYSGNPKASAKRTA
jgi:transposase-like protein